MSTAMDAPALMNEFARRTGIYSPGPSRRYLWTDAFAVCNWLGLARETGDVRHRDAALRLVERVHEELGSHRPDDARRGPLGGRSPEEAARHPTQAGLRIGKTLPERAAHQPLDPDRDWDRDGQYFHYLTKWMHALDQVARATGDETFHRWACELFDVAYRAFTFGPRGSRRMAWKMDIDLSRAVVPSMGHHDPLDGLVTALQLEATGRALGAPRPHLHEERADFASMFDPADLATTDALGIGGLLFDAGRLAQLDASLELASSILVAAADGLGRWLRGGELRAPAHHRLGFRELGLAIGLSALPIIERAPLDERGRVALRSLLRVADVRGDIVSFWHHDVHRTAATWIEHRDINDVMLATALSPAGFLELAPPRIV